MEISLENCIWILRLKGLKGKPASGGVAKCRLFCKATCYNKLESDT